MMGGFDIHAVVNMTVLFFLVVTAIAVVLSRHLLVSTIFLAIFSLLMASMYLILGAPDVAITEAAIGAGISTILLLAALLLTGEKEKPAAHPVGPLVIITITAGALIYATLGMPAFGDPNAVTNAHVVPHYLEKSGEEIGIPNVVTSVLASYRGFDTLGETFVIFTAGISILMLLGRKGEAKEID